MTGARCCASSPISRAAWTRCARPSTRTCATTSSRGRRRSVRAADVVVLEGVNVLQRGSGRVYVSDFVDFALYLDAEESDVQRWYLSRFLALRNGAFQRPESYFHRYAQLSDDEARAVASAIWERTNRPNLLNNIQPSRPRADVILEKGPDHFVERVLLRRA